jgi:hypothetical protein
MDSAADGGVHVHLAWEVVQAMVADHVPMGLLQHIKGSDNGIQGCQGLTLWVIPVNDVPCRAHRRGHCQGHCQRFYVVSQGTRRDV